MYGNDGQLGWVGEALTIGGQVWNMFGGGGDGRPAWLRDYSSDYARTASGRGCPNTVDAARAARAVQLDPNGAERWAAILDQYNNNAPTVAEMADPSTAQFWVFAMQGGRDCRRGRTPHLWVEFQEWVDNVLSSAGASGVPPTMPTGPGEPPVYVPPIGFPWGGGTPPLNIPGDAGAPSGFSSWASWAQDVLARAQGADGVSLERLRAEIEAELYQRGGDVVRDILDRYPAVRDILVRETAASAATSYLPWLIGGAGLLLLARR